MFLLYFDNLSCLSCLPVDLHQACLDCGFFYVVNHGISQEFMDEVFSKSKRFFNLTMEEKMKVLRNEKHRGYTPVLDELLDPDNQVHGWIYEFISFILFSISNDIHFHISSKFSEQIC